MTVSSFLPRQTRVLQQLFRYRSEQEQRQPESVLPVLNRFTIALAREAGTPAGDIARGIAQRLGWSVYDRELAEYVARELRLPLSAIEEIDERGQSWLLECLEALTTRQNLTQERYFHCLLTILRRLGLQGGSVIVGRGAVHVLPPHATLRVLLVGDCDDRVNDFSQRFHLDRSAAARKIEEVHRERGRFIREHFHTDPMKTRHYDLVLNTSQWPPADCADFIVEALHHKASGRRNR